ncbi:MAG: glycerol-3-phosphate 1-O-acyltransferase PlsY [Eubacteriales bacterium]|nr:glycerol-3-phosphate 1-O-acyltransferase PlsY [Eubacteriales bacterium]
MQNILLSLAVAALAYLLGCISTGIIVSSQSGVNIRTLGSKNTGASNVLRVMGLKQGLVTFLGDFIKATLACWGGSLILPGATFGIPGYGVMLAGLFAIIGHNWPVFYHFKGGKGVACSVAVIFFVDPLLGGISIALCVAVIAIWRYISAGSMVMLLTFAILSCAVHPTEWFRCAFAIVLLVMCVWRHRANLTRLRNGTESKIGQKATK